MTLMIIRIVMTGWCCFVCVVSVVKNCGARPLGILEVREVEGLVLKKSWSFC